MRKYITSSLISFRRERAYILGFGAKLLRFPLMVLVVASIWKAVYSQSPNLPGTFGGILVYYVLVSFLRICEGDFAFGLPYRVSDDIRTGNIAVLLARPIHYPLYAIAVESGRIGAHLLLGIPLLMVVVTAVTGAPEVVRLCSFLVSGMMGLLVSAEIGVILGLLAFWTGRVLGIRDVVHSVSFLLSGALIPLQYLPPWIRQVAAVLPFRQGYDIPVQVFMGSPLGGAVGEQLIWLTALMGVSRLVWTLGLRRFECQGG